MRTRRRFVALAGSAAAAIAIAVTSGVMFMSTGRVHAAMILQSFRESLSQGFRITFENVVGENVRADGEVSVTFAQPVDEQTEGDVPVQSLYLDAHLAGVPDSEMDGLNVQFRMADGEGQSWIYLRADSLPPALLEEEPLLGFFQNMTRNGLLLDLHELRTTATGDGHGGFAVNATGSAVVVDASASPDDDEGAGGPQALRTDDPKVQAMIRDALASNGNSPHVGVTTQVKTIVNGKEIDELDPATRELVLQALAGAAGDGKSAVKSTVHLGNVKNAPVPESMRKQIEEATKSGRGGFQIAVGASSDANAKIEPQLRVGAKLPTSLTLGHGGSADDAQFAPLEKLLSDIVSGKARGEEIGKLVALLNISPDDATLTESDPGMFVLTATNLGKSLSADTDEQAQLNKMVLKIAYRQDAGLQWAELSNVGDAGGKVRFEQLTTPIGAAQLDKNRVIEPGKTTVIDAGKLGSMFGLGSLLGEESEEPQ